jgi:hypothetical protein
MNDPPHPSSKAMWSCVCLLCLGDVKPSFATLRVAWRSPWTGLGVCGYQMTKSGNVMESRRQGLFYGSAHETMDWLPAGDVAPVKTIGWLGKLGRVMSSNAFPNIHATTFRIPNSALGIQTPVHIDLPYPCRISNIRRCTGHTVRMRRLNDD